MTERNVEISHYAQVMLNLIQRNRVGTSFVELTAALERAGMNTNGDLSISFGLNMFLWADMSEEFIQTIEEVRALNLVHPHPSNVFVYTYDGGRIYQPIAEDETLPLPDGYAEPHWLPVVWNVNEPESV